jgi:VanZ family protein
MAVLLATFYGAFDEVHQAFTPDRSPDVRDLVADCLGAAIGVAAILLVLAIIRKLRGAVSRLTAG